MKISRVMMKPPMSIGFTLAAYVLALVGTVHAQCLGKPIEYLRNGAWQVVAADFNHDGFPDLATVNPHTNNYRGLVSIYLADGTGTFTKPGIQYHEAFAVVDLAAGDFNNDGNLDIIDVSGDAYPGPAGLNTFLGNGDGTFSRHLHHQVFGRELSHIATGDFNGDGNLDVVVWSEQTFFFARFMGKGDGTFLGPFPVATKVRVPYLLLAGDYNHDNFTDLAVVPEGPFPNGIGVLLGNGEGTFRLGGIYESGTHGIIALTQGDFNEDGFLDIAANTGSPDGIAVFLGNGDGTFQPPVRYPAILAYKLVTADFNGDGHLDLFTTTGISNIWAILIGNGDGTFQNPVKHSNLTNDAWAIAAADFDQDGFADLVLGDVSGSVSVFPNLGNCP